MVEARICPDSLRSHPHEMRQDKLGRWYCPLKRDAELEKAYLDGLEQKRQDRIKQAAIEAFAVSPDVSVDELEEHDVSVDELEEHDIESAISTVGPVIEKLLADLVSSR